MWRSDYVETNDSIQICIYQQNLEAQHVKIQQSETEKKCLVVIYKDQVVWEKTLFSEWNLPVVHEVTAYKIQITLTKKHVGQHWPILFASQQQQQPELKEAKTKKPQNDARWSDVAKEADKEYEAEEAGDPNALFRKLFEHGDADTRKAMNRSYSLSGGTHLSTNWKEVEHAAFSPST